MCQQGLCTPEELEATGAADLSHSMGPLTMGNKYGPTEILEVLFNVQTVYGDTRYRPSPWLRRRGALGLSLMHTES
jgi:3-hydroxybutyryl-CoA dehydrogenase